MYTRLAHWLYSVRRTCAWRASARAIVASSVAMGAGLCAAQGQHLTLESWRDNDEPAWVKTLLPAFTAHHPGIHVRMQSTPPVQYDSALNQRLSQGTAGDLMTCRPFDRSIELFEQGHLQDITSMPELRQFRSHNKLAWTTYYADRVFCMPVAAVTTGFFYNTRIFEALNLSPPQTEEALWEVLHTIHASGQYLPLAFGTRESWMAAQVLFVAMGPNHWEGEQGRKNILTGRARFTDPPYVHAWKALAQLGTYLPPQHATLDEQGARELFLSGQAAIYPAGSWEIPFLSDHPMAQHIGVFAPPPPQQQHSCYVLSHLDKGIGINDNTKHSDAAQSFVRWLSTPDFSHTLANTLHGFFPLSNHPVNVHNPLAKEMLTWSQKCETTIRINSQFLNQAWPALEDELWEVSVQVLRQDIRPETAAQRMAHGVHKWFKPL